MGPHLLLTSTLLSLCPAQVSAGFSTSHLCGALRLQRFLQLLLSIRAVLLFCRLLTLSAHKPEALEICVE